MLTNERLSLAARMHMLLRRKTGRVTDIEWLAVNADYAAEIIRFARTRTQEPEMEDLAELADCLEQSMGITASPAVNHIRKPQVAPTPVDKNTHFRPKIIAEVATNSHNEGGGIKRYIGGLR